jgi:hypothetical protein
MGRPQTATKVCIHMFVSLASLYPYYLVAMGTLSRETAPISIEHSSRTGCQSKYSKSSHLASVSAPVDSCPRQRQYCKSCCHHCFRWIRAVATGTEKRAELMKKNTTEDIANLMSGLGFSGADSRRLFASVIIKSSHNILLSLLQTRRAIQWISRKTDPPIAPHLASPFTRPPPRPDTNRN